MRTRKFPKLEVWGLLWVTRTCEARISSLLIDDFGIPRNTVQRGMHLTVYYARRRLPDLVLGSQPVDFSADIKETRFMVLAPGGENPRPDLVPSRRSVGIRLTRRNQAIRDILKYRRELYQKETESVTRNRKPTTDWTNAFGARHYQPHIKLLRPGSGIDYDLTKIGDAFRSGIPQIQFGKFEVRIRNGGEFIKPIG